MVILLHMKFLETIKKLFKPEDKINLVLEIEKRCHILNHSVCAFKDLKITVKNKNIYFYFVLETGKEVTYTCNKKYLSTLIGKIPRLLTQVEEAKFTTSSTIIL